MIRASRLLLDPGPAIDPYTLAGDDGILFDSGSRVLVGLGTALAVPLHGGLDDEHEVADVVHQLRAIDCADPVGPTGSGVVAFGALPFDRGEAAAVTVPEVVYGREADGHEWVTVVGDGSGDPLPPTATGLRAWLRATARRRREGGRAPGGPLPTTPPVVPPLADDDHFVDMVRAALDDIGRGQLEKVVLSRHVDVSLDPGFAIPLLLERWRALEPSCTVFSMPVPDGRFVGASPELLVRRTGAQVLSRPLAGTAGRAPNGSQALLDSSKDATEHRLVVETIGRLLAPLCAELDVPSHPDLVHLRSVSHLGTAITGRLRDGAAPSALELVALLHPTPAVGGVPRAEALSVIARLEAQRRGAYAGPVGYVDAAGDGEWAVGIRAAVVSDGTARLAAGVGIVEGSEPRAELQETALKLAAVVDALAPGDERTAAWQAG